MSFYAITDYPLFGWEADFLNRLILKEGISDHQVLTVLPERPPEGRVDKAAQSDLVGFREKLSEIRSSPLDHVFLILGDWLLREFTGYESAEKWHCSPLKQGRHWVLPALTTSRVQKDMTQQVWLSVAAHKAARAYRGELKEPAYDFIINPPMEELLYLLRGPIKSAPTIGVDVETGRGQINTVGFSWPCDTGMGVRSLAFNALPDRFGAKSFYEVFQALKDILESDQHKLLQNFIYEFLYFSRYGIRLRGVIDDTMIRQKFLWPEHEMGLDCIGRMYTDMPYWKDDNKDWSNIRDWVKHYEYNCKDTTGTYLGHLGQIADLQERGLQTLYREYTSRLFPRVAEMCSRGLPVSAESHDRLRREVTEAYETALRDLRKESGAAELNPKSHQQVKKFLTSEPRKYTLPKAKNSAGNWADSTDGKSLRKLKLKHPEDRALDHLLKLSKTGKILSSYLDAPYDSDDRLRYQITAGATETMRMAGYCDPWDKGFNPQTVPGGSKGINVKQIFVAPPGREFGQIDLKQAESRFVAYDAPDLTLIRMLEDPLADLHSFVAEEICRQWGKDPRAERALASWKKTWRQLGKKSGHGANYGEKEDTLIDTCLVEMDLVITRPQATLILEAYHTLFGGIRRWHANIRKELCRNRKLTTPWGWERYFYGRMNDQTFREAYAFRPQATVPFVINQLMLHLCELREAGSLDFGLLLQGHDSLLFEVPEGGFGGIKKAAETYANWQPGFDLPGGRLVIPVDCQTGKVWGNVA